MTLDDLCNCEAKKSLRYLNDGIAITSDTSVEDKGLERSLDQPDNKSSDGNCTPTPSTPVAVDTWKADDCVKTKTKGIGTWRARSR